MDPREAEELAYDLIAEHVSPHTYGIWEIAWMNTRKTAGRTCRDDQVIQLSTPVVKALTRERVIVLVKHEIAHVHTPEYLESHGPEWAANATALGIDPAPKFALPNAMFKWLATCSGCGGYDGLFRLGPVAAAGRWRCDGCNLPLHYVQQY